MAELRYNPVMRDWVMVASHRQERPQMPEDWCPFCPGSGCVPDQGYTVLRYQNDFPALSQTPPEPDDVAQGVFRTAAAYGRCEVLLYSDRHTATVGTLDDAHAHKLARMWKDCYLDMAADRNIKYVFLFENRGEAVGVTMPHPHGQAYGYSYIPQKIREELDGARLHYTETGRCLFCDLLAEEKRADRRIIFHNESFAVYVPFFSSVAYGVHVTSQRHLPHPGAMTERELDALGETVRDCVGMYDALFDTAFPYMMCMHCALPDRSSDDFFHFHIEFVPPMRAREKQQFFASSETGAGAFCNPTSPEEKAEELRRAYRKSRSQESFHVL